MAEVVFDPHGETVGSVVDVTHGMVTGQKDGGGDSYWRNRGNDRANVFEPLGEAAGAVQDVTRGMVVGDTENDRSFHIKRGRRMAEAFAPLPPLPVATYARIGSLPLNQQ